MTAALIYQHATRQADQQIADHLGSRFAELSRSANEDADSNGDDGAAGGLARTS
jgi:hypothetical protein